MSNEEDKVALVDLDGSIVDYDTVMKQELENSGVPASRPSSTGMLTERTTRQKSCRTSKRAASSFKPSRVSGVHCHVILSDSR